MEYGFENGLNEVWKTLHESIKIRTEKNTEQYKLEEERRKLYEEAAIKQNANESDDEYTLRISNNQKEIRKLDRKINKLKRETDDLYNKEIELSPFISVANDRLTANSNERGTLNKEINEYEALKVEAENSKKNIPAEMHKYIDAMINNGYQKEINIRKDKIAKLLEEQEKLLNGSKEAPTNEAEAPVNEAEAPTNEAEAPVNEAEAPANEETGKKIKNRKKDPEKAKAVWKKIGQVALIVAGAGAVTGLVFLILGPAGTIIMQAATTAAAAMLGKEYLKKGK